MDSINKQQPEDNHEDLQGSKAQKKIKDLIDKAPTCFFCTRKGNQKRLVTRPMSVQKLEKGGSLLFLSASDSHKNRQLSSDPFVQLLFQGSDYTDFLELHGTATISTDKQLIKELWNPILKTWFTEGVDDPRITVIRVNPEGGYYWDNKNIQAVSFLKRIAGAVMGKTLDDSMEGKLEV